MNNSSQQIANQIANLSPEQRALFEKRLKQRGIELPNQKIPRRKESNNIPLSFAQARLWFIGQLDSDNSSYTVPSALHIQGNLNVAVLEKTLNEIVKRHEILRTTFTTTEEKQPIQVIAPFQPFTLPVIDLQPFSDECTLLANSPSPLNPAILGEFGSCSPQSWGARGAKTAVRELSKTDAEVQRLATAEAQQSFDLSKPLLKLKLLQTEKTEYVLLITAHHIISDRWSIGVFLREIAVLYQAFSQERDSPLPELPIQYADWAIWQRRKLQGEELEHQIAYWKKQLAGNSPLELPTDKPRPALPAYQGAQYPLVLSKSLSDKIKNLSAKEGVTLFTLLLTAFKVLLHRYTSQDDIIVGTDIANRDRAETEGLIGLLVNTLVLRTDLLGNSTFRDLLARVREVTLGAYAHQDLPFEKLVEVLNPERDLSQMMPLFQVKFDLQLAPVKPLELGDLTIERLPFESGTVKYELRFNLQDTEQGIRGQIEYSTELFEETTVARLGQHFYTLLESIVANPEQRLSQLPLLTKTEQQQLLQWNDTVRNYSTDRCIHELFEAQVERTPEEMAIVYDDREITYRELNAKANQLAHYLQKLGVKPEVKVGICLTRSPQMLVGLLGILKAGGAYVPLDPNYPQERLDLILEDAQVSVLLTQLGIGKASWEILDRESEQNLSSGVTPDNLAYVIYTSGSTGKPKGVAIEHRSTVQLLHWAKEVFTAEELSGVLASTSICFDLSVFEIFVPLSWGGKLILVEDALALPNSPAANEVTLINTVPSAIAQLLRIDGIPPSIKTVNLAGEALRGSIVEKLGQKSHIQKIYNLYGPSEDTTYSTYALVNSHVQGSVPIGKPLTNTQVYVLDRYLQPLPVGVPGELYIGSNKVARGYLGRAELTAEKFIANPFTESDERLYKTGDLVRYRHDGNLEFLGRLDNQVKLRGYRVEIGEIEAILGQHPAVQDNVVVLRDEPDNKYLVAYVVLEPEYQPQAWTSLLHHFLAEKLPSYMIPNAFVRLEALPLLPNGKVDRRSLPAPDSLRPELETTYVEPNTEIEKTIASIWQKELDLEKVGIHDNFFQLGGHSLLGIKVIAQIGEVLEIEIPLRSLFQKPTIAGLVEEIGQKERSLPPKHLLPTITPELETKHQPFPLTDIQQAYLIGRNEAFELGNIATHGYREIETVGLTVEQVEVALQRAIARHDMLRVIVAADGKQQILPSVPPYQIKVADLQGQNPEQIATKLAEIRDRLSHQILSTDRWPLFEIHASLLDNGIRFHISFDVLMGDAWSFQILGWELAQLMQNPETPLPPLTLSFRDYVLAEIDLRNSQLYHRSLEYWRTRIPTLPLSPELPLQKNLASVKSPRFVRRTGKLPAKSWQALKHRATKTGITPSGLLLGAFAEILTTWSKNPRFTINLTLFNRLPLHPEVNQIIGDFTSSTLLVVDNSGKESFEVRARRIQEQLWQDLDHRYVSGVWVLRELARSRGRISEAIAPVVFTSTLTQNISSRTWQTEVVYSLSQTSQVYLDHQVSEIGGALVFNWDAIEEVFPLGLLDDMFNAYCCFLDRLVSEEELWQAKTKQLLPPEQVKQLAALNATDANIGQHNTLLHTLFFDQVPLHWGKAAIITTDRTLTYQELSDRTLQLSARLQQLGARPNQPVAIVMEKGWEQVVAALGILSSGAAYVPIDPDLPTERRLHLLKEIEAQQIVTQSWLEHSLEWPKDVSIICVDTLEGKTDFPPSLGLPSSLAYIIYTSGSTGLPKGVAIDHRGAVNTILDINQRFRVTSQDRVIALSSLSFDLSVYDIFGTLAAGGTIVIPDAEATKDAAHWAELIQNYQVTIWNSVPALMQMLVDHLNLDKSITSPSLRLVLLSGDWLPLNLPERVQSLFKAEIVSLGGATEASIWSIFYSVVTVDPTWKSIPYGRPLTNQQFYALKETLEQCPLWVTGQLYIGGIGLAKGYWHNQEKTKASFIIHPQTQERLYKTGDLGRYLPDGNIEFLGREDFQVKVNGYRIELGEIEATLHLHPAIKEAVVTAVGEASTNQQLVAYIVPDKQESQGILSNPLERIEFKLKQPGLRQSEFNQSSIALPKAEFHEDLIQAYLLRQSYRQFLDRPISLEKFSNFVSCLLQIRLNNSPLPKYRYPSAGSLYPVQTYLYIKPNRVEGLEAGYYYYHPDEHHLILLNNPGKIDNRIYDENTAIFEQSAFALFLIGQLTAIAPIYGNKAKDFCLLEAGYMGQLLMETAPAQEIGLCPIGNLKFEQLQDSLQLESSQILLHSFVGGAIDLAQTQQWLPTTLKEKSKVLRRETAEPAWTSSESVTDKLNDYLQQKLPRYMIPSSYIVLGKLPLTANGKLDRRALPTPDKLQTPSQKAYISPRTEIEKTIANIWQKNFGVEKIGIYDNFFDLGGNSLSATQVVAQMRQTFQVELKIRSFFEKPTIAEQALVIQGSCQPKVDNGIERIERRNTQQTLEELNQISEKEIDALLEKLLREEGEEDR